MRARDFSEILRDIIRTKWYDKKTINEAKKLLPKVEAREKAMSENVMIQDKALVRKIAEKHFNSFDNVLTCESALIEYGSEMLK